MTTRREKHMTVLDLVGDFLEAGCRPIEAVDGITLGRCELLHAVRWVRGHDATGGAPEGAPPWWAQVIYELRSERREHHEDAA